MIATNYIEAIDEMFTTFQTAWIAGSAAIVGSVPEIQWPGIEKPGNRAKNDFWARVHQETVDESQSTLRNGDNGQRYSAQGLIFVQVFCPKSDSESMAKGRQLAILARNAFRGNSTSGKIWFRNARIQELPIEKDWNQFNIISEYEYDEQV